MPRLRRSCRRRVAAKRPPSRKRPSHSRATAASGVGVDPERRQPLAPWPPRHCRCWSISHWSQVSGAPGRKPKRGQSGRRRSRARRPARRPGRPASPIARGQLAHGHHLGPADFVGLAAMAGGVERGGGDRLARGRGHRPAGIGSWARSPADRQPRHQPGEAVGELVLRPEHQARADDRRAREGGADRRLALALGAAIVATSPSGSAPIAEIWTNAAAPASRAASGDVAGAVDVDRRACRRFITADQVDRPRRRRRPPASTARRPGDVGGDEVDLADLAERLEEIARLRGSRWATRTRAPVRSSASHT